MVCYGTISQSSRRGINQHTCTQKGNPGPCIAQERGTVLSACAGLADIAEETAHARGIKGGRGEREVRGSLITTCFFLPS